MSEPPIAENPRAHFEFHALLPHVAEPRVLLLREPDGWALPHFQPEQRSFAGLADAGRINRALADRLGVAVTVLRCAHLRVERGERERVEAIFALENHSPEWAPPADARWVGRATSS